MKRILIALLMVGLLAGLVYAASPSVEEQNRVKFTAEGQSTTASYAISSISWVSASGDEIGGGHGFILEETSGADIASCEATAVSDQCQFTFPEPLVVMGLNVPHLDGDLYVYGKRR
jgi:hypothetical protein